MILITVTIIFSWHDMVPLQKIIDNMDYLVNRVLNDIRKPLLNDNLPTTYFYAW